jgi:hypothetical protein
MITSDEAERIATEVIGPATAGDGQGWHLEEFDSGWFIREDWMSEKSVRGGSFCVVERATGRVLAFPSSISPTRIMTELLPVIQGERGGVIAGERVRDVKAPPGVAGRGLVFTVSRGRSVCRGDLGDGGPG